MWTSVFLPRKLGLIDVLAVQGKPDLVYVARNPEIANLYYFRFFYAAKGLLLHGSRTYPEAIGARSLTLLPDIGVDEAEYFVPDEGLTSYYTERWHPWPGLGKEIPVGQ